MDRIGWNKKPVYAEPSPFWNIDVPFVKPRGGEQLLDIPQEGFVFNAHMYDEKRQSIGTRAANNGAHIPEIELIREEAQYLSMPSFLSEFGQWASDGKGDGL